MDGPVERRPVEETAQGKVADLDIEGFEKRMAEAREKLIGAYRWSTEFVQPPRLIRRIIR